LVGKVADVSGYEVGLIPELHGAGIADAGEGGSGGRGPVGGEDGFPYDQYANVGIGNLGEDLLDCGGPPQAGESGGGEEDDDADGVGGVVEGLLKGAEVGGAEGGKRRLAGWGLAGSEAHGNQEKKEDGGDGGPEENDAGAGAAGAGVTTDVELAETYD
jgi:hypothetical protein